MDMDATSRILVVSSTLDKGKEFIDNLKTLSFSQSTSTSKVEPSSSSSSSSSSLITPSSSSLTIPWTITNKYYTASVHFYLCTLDDIFRSKTPIPSAPAVVYVFREGEEEECKKEAAELARVMKLGDLDDGEGGHEVVLGVRIRARESELAASAQKDAQVERAVESMDVDEDEEDEENASIDSTLMALGLEYVDATRSVEVDQLGKRSFGDNEGDSIPALPRVLDALSTIMWPSMKSSHPKGAAAAGHSLDLNGSFDLEDTDGEADEERDAIMKELLESTAAVTLVEKDGTTDKEQEEESKELMELMKAFVKDAEHKSRPTKPWITTSGPTEHNDDDGMTMSPTGVAGNGDEDLLTPFGTGEGKKLKHKVSLRFEDDFTAFVEAPPTATGKEKKKPFFIDFADANNSLQWDSNKTPTIPASGYATAGGLTPEADRDEVFSRYRSLGSVSDFGDFTADDDGDVEGVPAGGVYEALEDAVDSEDEDLPSQGDVQDAARKIYGRKGGEFDLDRTFGMIQQMKTEISGIEDDEERRRSAARVALGVVYGLQ
ncbi:hypothetical protein CPB83DRAFT_898034 [Crepidotus variabilis]|uniref:Uncharacterized protein n=1 Tax=Crepidotus variabilis TaxID=179855 RepID=A0A9P6JKI2_9AGAR|nr:hypothetical protein CPB83DRAFT_898034 [Crepidotus variabilis]